MPKYALPALGAIGVVALLAAKLWAAGSPWMQPYRVSNLEWLALRLDVEERTECLSRGIAGFENSCTERHYVARAPDTILVVDSAIGPAQSASRDRDVDSAKKLVARYAKEFQLPTPNVEVSLQQGGDDRAPEHRK
jgi:hypothetical protein